MDRTHLESYIDKVISDSCKAEKRPNDVQWQYIIVDDDVMLFAMKSKFQRVRRRICYRLLNNLESNFSLKFNLVLPDPMRESTECREAAIFDLYGGRSDGPDGLDPNHSFMQACFFGKLYTVRSVYGIRSDEELGLPHLNKLKENGFDYEKDGNWDKFREAYKAAYGETPIEGMKRERKYWQARKEEEAKKRKEENDKAQAAHMEECHRRQYERDELRHGCGYWSVCDERACPCSPSAPVSQGFSEKTWQSLKKSWDQSLEV